MLGRKDAALSSDGLILVLQRHMIQSLLKTEINVQSFPPSKNGKKRFCFLNATKT